MSAKPEKQTAHNKAPKSSAPGIGTGKPGPGRKAGIPNRVTKAVRDQVIGALEELGGQDYLVRIAKKSPALFFALVNKVIPNKIEGEINVTGELAVRLEQARQALRKAQG